MNNNNFKLIKSIKNMKNDQNQSFNVAILVLGELNKSPRMINHTIAIYKIFPNIDEISLIGFDGGDLRKDIIENNNKIKLYYLYGSKLFLILRKLPNFLFLLISLLKIIFQVCSLILNLIIIPKPNFLILQNPPGIPAIIICGIICYFRKILFIIDWHNYGYSILKVNKRNKFLVYIAFIYEFVFGKFSNINLCVSNALKLDLENKGLKNIIVVPDLSMPHIFNPYFKNDLNLCYKLFNKYSNVFNVQDFFEINQNKNELIYNLKKNRPLTLISSTSWTPDEDFYLLLDSIIIMENEIKNSESYLHLKKKILLIITGKGPMKEKFMKTVNSYNLQIFEIKSIWLDSDDYPKILPMMDFGICLHYSSSGLDLPMKIVDMFSSALPVIAINYSTLNELVINGKNGIIFNSKRDLVRILKTIFFDYINDDFYKKYENYRNYLIKTFSQKDWINQWKENILSELINKKIVSH